jgi:hypothetical protein
MPAKKSNPAPVVLPPYDPYAYKPPASCYTSSLTPQQAANIMASPASSNTDFVDKTNVTRDAATSYCVGIVLRNLNTGVETLLTQPTFPKIESNFETRWFLPYRTNPAFREFDVMPVLDNPALHLDKLFTTCVFPTRDGQMLQAMAFLVHEKDSVLKGFPGVHDHVYIDIHSQISLSLRCSMAC